jgi:hypothetical protein
MMFRSGFLRVDAFSAPELSARLVRRIVGSTIQVPVLAQVRRNRDRRQFMKS